MTVVKGKGSKTSKGSSRPASKPFRGGLQSKVQQNIGKGKPSGGPGRAQKIAENPFDKFANARKKHEVINRRVKGEDRNVGRARDKV